MSKAKKDAATKAELVKNNVQYIEPYQWKPGESGNPSGRPKSTHEMQIKARELTDMALERLAQLIMSADERVALGAVHEAINRGHGKPREQDKPAQAFAMTRAEVIAALRAKLAAVDKEGEQ